MEMRIKYIDGKRLNYAIHSGAMEVMRNSDHLDRINVFPVADGDTGSNLSSTMNSMLRNTVFVDRIDKSFQSLAESAMLGARGNSGIIFAQFINGIAIEIKNNEVLCTRSFGESVMKAAGYAYKAMLDPVEGTMLTVIREWSRAVYDSRAMTDDFAVLLNDAQKIVRKSLSETPNVLRVLKDSGVVDSGAKGFVHFTEGIVKLINSGNIRDAVSSSYKGDHRIQALDDHSSVKDMPSERYCSEVLIRSDESIDIEALKTMLKGYGSSVIVAGGNRNTRIHVHTDRPAEMFARIPEYGKVIEKKIDDMHGQYLAVNNKKSTIALVTDSVADLPKETILNENITVIPMNLEIDGNLYFDKVTIFPEQFRELAGRSPIFPKTSQPSLKSFENSFAFLLSHYEEVIGIFVSSSLSGTFNSAVKALELLPEETRSRVTVIDTKLNSAAQGLVVYEAAEAVSRGAKKDEILKIIYDCIPATKIFVSVDTFEYMVKGGRLSPMKGRFASAMNLKPIVSLDENGKGISFAKAFSRKANKKKIMKTVGNLNDEFGIKRYAVVHHRGEILANDYSRGLEDLLGMPPEYISEVSSVVALSAGEKAVAVAVQLKRREKS